MQTTIKSEVDYKDPKTYGKTYKDASIELSDLKFAGVEAYMCRIIGTNLFTTVLLSKWIIENKLKHLKIVM